MRKLLFLILLVIPMSILSQIPEAINWQGIIQDAAGNKLNGNYTISAKLYSVSSGGSPLWSETHNNVSITDGITNLQLGSQTSLNLSFDIPYWLEITVGAGSPLTRILLTTAPYSYRSKYVDGISENDKSNWNTAYNWGDHSLAGYLKTYTETDPTWSGTANTTSNIGRTGSVGIGISTPINNLHLSSSSVFTGLRLTNTASGETSDDGILFGMQYQDNAPTNRYGILAIKEDIPLYIKTGNSGNYFEQLTLMPYGNIGIGNSNPINNLHLSSSSVFTGLRITNTASGETSNDGILLGMQYQDNTPINQYGFLKLYENIPLHIKVGSSGSSFEQLTILPSGNIGIGTSDPTELLHINNATGAARIKLSASSTTMPELDFFSGSTYKGAIGYQNTSNYLFIYENGNIIFKNGRIGIQSIVNPSYGVELPNNSSNGIGRALAYSWNIYSDSRLKSDRSAITYGLNELMKLEPIKYFHHNSITENGSIKILSEGTYDIGFIAQDLFKIIPEIVSKPINENIELWSISYEKLTPVLVKAMQEQQEIINKQQAEIDELKQKYEKLIELLQNQSNK